MPNRNANLAVSRKNKNDEYYTRYQDIEAELAHYPKNIFKGKTVYLNCDNPKHSNFWKYFKTNFKALKLKTLQATYLATSPYLYTYDGQELHKKHLLGNGSFDSPACIKILRAADIVVTNPPFSLAREYIKTLIDAGKPFVLVGDLNWVTYASVFPYIKSGKIKLGYIKVKNFITPDGSKSFGNKYWFTSLGVKKKYKKLITGKRYNKNLYQKYDNYNALNVDKVADIPDDYTGVMGVPITFAAKLDPEQFDIIGLTDGCGRTKMYKNVVQHRAGKKPRAMAAFGMNTRGVVKAKPDAKIWYTANGKQTPLAIKYVRLLIKRKRH